MTKPINIYKIWTFLCIGGFLLCQSASYSINSADNFPSYVVDNNSDFSQPEIRLLNGTTGTGCSSDKNSSSEFPNDLFTEEERDHGAVILHFIAALYCFGMIGIVCGDYFLPSVDCICCDLKLSQDVAAATFMSFATCTPEFFTILIGTFITETDIGLGAVVGSGMFNILGVATCGGLAASKPIKLDWWPLYRDSVIYVGALAALIIVIADNKVTLWESIALCICYILYFVVMSLNLKLRKIVKGCVKKIQQRWNPQAASTNATALPLSTINITVTSENQAQIFNNNNVQQTTSFNSPEKITDFEEDELGNGTYKPYFIMYGEFRRKSAITIGRRQSGDRRPSKRSSHSDIFPNPDKPNNQVSWAEVYGEIYNSTVKNTVMNDGTLDKNIFHYDDSSTAPADSVIVEEPENASDNKDSESEHKIWQMPDGSVWESIFWLVMLPATLIFYVTIPDCRTSKWRKLYPLTFLMCIVWIGITSYLGTWMISVLGDTIGIPDSVMGLTFLAAGGSMPEAISTVIMARQGAGGMGFSNSLGGNTMDICLCLAVPWLIKCSLSGVVYVESSGLQYNCIALFIGIFILLTVATFTKFHMNKKLGVISFLCYLVFIVMSILIEIGVIIKVCNPAPAR